MYRLLGIGVFTHQHPVSGGRAAQSQVEQEPVGAGNSPEPIFGVDRLYEVRGDLGVVARERTCDGNQNSLRASYNFPPSTHT